jgi:rhamnose transport system permease protein
MSELFLLEPVPSAAENSRRPVATPTAAPWSWRMFARWEWLLVLAVLADFALNAYLSPYFLNPWTLSDASFNFTEKAIVALPLALLIIAGEIDISVAGIIALASVTMGLGAAIGLGIPAIAGIGLGTGLLAGMFNGVIVTVFGVSSIVATIGTMSLFRGVAYAVLGDRALKAYPPGFNYFGQGYVAGPVSFELTLFLVLAVILGIVLHTTVAGRRIYAIGANPIAARFSGVRLRRYRFWLFALTGLCSGLAAILLTSRLGSTRPSIAQGWELDIISMVILGGVAVSGGKGSIVGVVLAALLMGLITFGLGLLNVPGIVLSIVIGTVLISLVALPPMFQRSKS